MKNDLPIRLADGAIAVVGSGLAARQLEPYLARLAAARPSDAWVSASIHSYPAWLTALWSRSASGSHRLLTVRQSLALWRRVIEDSTVAGRLISSRTATRWAAEAWQLLWQWRIDPRDLAATDGDLDFESFLRWARNYRKALDNEGWIDAPLAAAELIARGQRPRSSDGAVIWADIAEATPAQQALYRQLEHDDWTMAEWLPPKVQRSSSRVCVPDGAGELTAAAQWAAEKQAQSPGQRLALVIPDLKTRADEVRRALEDYLDPNRILLGSATDRAYFDPNGEPSHVQPLIGAAMTALELVSSRGTFGNFSRWLRSPYFSIDPEDEGDRSELEKKLRIEVSAQLGFLDGYRAGSLPRQLRDAAPRLATRLSHALKLLDKAPRYATPTRWTRVWQQILAQLGWTAGAHDPSASVIPQWERALNELSLLTPIVGAISMTEALAELELVLEQPRAGGPIPLSGISLLERPEDIGPGYDAVWLAGITDTRWPRPAKANPLLPLRLQLDNGMPGSSPQDSSERCQRTTQRLIDRVPELVFSWPARVNDYPAEPSPLLAKIPAVTLKTLVSSSSGRLAERMRGTRAREQHDDPAPALETKEIPGGSGTLSVHARCPLRAFMESRLGARPLEPLARGLSARQRGIVTHRVLELFLRRLPDRTALAAWAQPARDDWTASCVEKALNETFGAAKPALRTVYYLERERLVVLVESLLANDLKRPDFSVACVEERLVAELNGFLLTCRLDRIDELASGGVAIIDYKTGRNATPNDWLRPRLRDTQLPLYAQTLDLDVTATVIAAVQIDGVKFKGIWAQNEEFPGRVAKLPDDRDWSAQLELWHKQLETLIAEYATGDTRILLDDLDQAKGPFAPLTRIIEQLALARGWLDERSAP